MQGQDKLFDRPQSSIILNIFVISLPLPEYYPELFSLFLPKVSTLKKQKFSALSYGERDREELGEIYSAAQKKGRQAGVSTGGLA